MHGETAPAHTQLDTNSRSPLLSLNDLEGYSAMEPRLSREEEDALLKVIRMDQLENSSHMAIRIPHEISRTGWPISFKELYNCWKISQMKALMVMLVERRKVRGNLFYAWDRR